MTNLLSCCVVLLLSVGAFCQGQPEEDGYCTTASNQLMCFKTTLDWTNEVKLRPIFYYYTLPDSNFEFLCVRVIRSQQNKVNPSEILPIQKQLALEVHRFSKILFY